MRWVTKLLLFLDQRWMHFLLIACLMTAVALGVHQARWRWSEFLDHLVLDKLFLIRGSHTPEDVATKLPHTRHIVMVELRHPIPRPLMAKLIGKLRLARVVAFDIAFVDHAAELEGEEKDWYGSELQAWRRDDQVLARAIKEAGNVVLGTWPEEIRVDDPEEAGRYRLEQVWQKPPPELWESARYRAHVYVGPDPQDGVVRRVQLFQETLERTPALGLAVAAAVLGIPLQEVQQLPIVNQELQLGPHRIPLDRDGRMLIDYLGGRECFEYDTNRIAYTRVLDLYEPEDFQDLTVFVGEVSFKSKEIVSTPFGGIPGMQVHANIAATLLNPSGPPSSLPLWQTALIAWLMALLLVAPLLRFPLWGSFAVAIAQVALAFMLSAWVFIATRQVLATSIPIMAIALTYNAVALYEYRRARSTLGRFIGSEMVSQALHVFSRLRLGGRVEEATAVFCDVRGYSTLSEYLPPEEVARLINAYTQALVKVVRQHRGRPINYQGDGVFVLFEESLAGKDHAVKAVRTAIELQEVFRQLRKQWAAQGAPDLEIGIGIETGMMTIGLVGADEHMQFSALGDAVNVAARVQTLTTRCGYDILTTRNTYERVKEVVPAVACGSHQVKGREQPVEVYGIGLPRAQPSH